MPKIGSRASPLSPPTLAYMPLGGRLEHSALHKERGADSLSGTHFSALRLHGSLESDAARVGDPPCDRSSSPSVGAAWVGRVGEVRQGRQAGRDPDHARLLIERHLPRRFPHPCAGTQDGPTDDWSSRVRPKCAPGPGNTCALSSASSQDRPRGYGDSGPAAGWNSRRSERTEAKNGRGIGIIGRPEGAQPPAQPQEVVYCAPCSQSVTARGS